MRHLNAYVFFLLVMLCPLGLAGDELTLSMTDPIACKTITGYEDYVVLPDAAITNHDKLLVYYRPKDYKIERTKTGGYRAHLVQEVRVRKRGEKTVLWSKPGILDFEAVRPEPLGPIYLSNSIGLRNFKVGEYDLDLILHDKIGDTKTTSILKFQIVAPKANSEPPSKN